jgi:hypothetical protein
VPLERAPARDHLVEDRPERELIGAVVDGVPAGLLRGHVEHRAHDGPLCRDQVVAPSGLRQDLHQTEVEDLGEAIRGDHEVSGLQVAMHDPG